MLKVKPFRQKTGYCGPASLKMVLDYYGVEKSEKDLAELTDCTMEVGVEGEKLVEVAKRLGLAGQIKDDASLDDIRHFVLEKQVPVIVDWFDEDDGHYSVVVDIDDTHIYFVDPSIGMVRTMALEKFWRVWFDFPGEYIRTKDDLTIRRMMIIYKEGVRREIVKRPEDVAEW